jgi:hypothetical protein
MGRRQGPEPNQWLAPRILHRPLAAAGFCALRVATGPREKRDYEREHRPVKGLPLRTSNDTCKVELRLSGCWQGQTRSLQQTRSCNARARTMLLVPRQGRGSPLLGRNKPAAPASTLAHWETGPLSALLRPRGEHQASGAHH